MHANQSVSLYRQMDENLNCHVDALGLLTLSLKAIVENIHNYSLLFYFLVVNVLYFSCFVMYGESLRSQLCSILWGHMVQHTLYVTDTLKLLLHCLRLTTQQHGLQVRMKGVAIMFSQLLLGVRRLLGYCRMCFYWIYMKYIHWLTLIIFSNFARAQIYILEYW